jgi:hypothetical protein
MKGGRGGWGGWRRGGNTGRGNKIYKMVAEITYICVGQKVFTV